MYIFKEELSEEIKEYFKLKSLAIKVGISQTTMSQIVNSRRACPKPTAYCITKMIDQNAEIEDYFNIVK